MPKIVDVISICHVHGQAKCTSSQTDVLTLQRRKILNQKRYENTSLRSITWKLLSKFSENRINLKVTAEKDDCTTRFKFFDGVYVNKFTQSLRT